MSDFHWELFEYRLNKIQGILQKIMLTPLLFTHIFGWYGIKEIKYSRIYLLYLPLLMAVPSEDYYLLTKDK